MCGTRGGLTPAGTDALPSHTPTLPQLSVLQDTAANGDGVPPVKKVELEPWILLHSFWANITWQSQQHDYNDIFICKDGILTTMKGILLMDPHELLLSGVPQDLKYISRVSLG